MPADPKMQPRLRRPGTPKPWCVEQAASISPTGKVRAKWFKTKELANAWIKDEEKRLRAYTDKARNLTQEEKVEAAEAFPIAREHGFSLLDAVREKAERVVRERASVPIVTVVEEVLAQLRLEKKSKPHVNNAEYVGNKLAAAFPGALVCDLSTNSLQDWLKGLAAKFAPATLKQHRRYVSLICEYACRRGYLAINPARDVRLARDTKKVFILTPEQTKALLNAAAPEIRPYLALCAFAGLRPAEAAKLHWKHVGAGEIYIEAESAKTRKHRNVEIVPNLRAWLDAAPATTGHIHYSREERRQAAKAAGLLPWKQDCLRHSFGSYWLAIHQDANKLSHQMGNSPAIIHSNYRLPVSKTAASTLR